MMAARPLTSLATEGLGQIASEGCCVCPLCGAIVARDGSVVS
jgi:hypothetical protein